MSRASQTGLQPWRAQPGPQLTAIQHDVVDEILYGGAVFGGKSDFLLGDFAQDVPGPYGKYWHGILFRKTYAQLEDLIARSKEIYPAWFGLKVSRAWSKTDKLWTWPNGATLKLRYLESDDDYLNYWGHAYTWMGWDELGLWASAIPYLRMKARLRCAEYAIPNMRIRSSANPGGPGHQWVKAYFGIDKHPLGGVVLEAPDGSGMRRLYIKARLADNKIGAANDPKYEQRLEGLGSKDFVKALKEGDWNIVAGAYFDGFSIDRHIVDPFTIPKHWTRLRSCDWGSAKPFSVGWYAVSDGELPQFPRGALVKYREWYGMKPNEPNVGLKLTAEQVAQGIIDRETTIVDGRQVREKIDDSVIDPSAYKEDGGPSHSERMGNMGVHFRRADNSRIAGWDQLRDRLRGGEEEVGDGRDPMLFFFDTCVDSIRTIPALQHDLHKPEDVDSDSEDHAADECRYVCMARPMVRKAPDKTPARWPTQQTINEIMAARRRARRG